MPSNKPRILHNNKDMMMTLIPLVVISFIIAGIASQCSFHPGAPKMETVVAFDAQRAYEYDARTLDFPIRVPEAPAGWQPNSGSRVDVTGEGGGTITAVGYVTAQGRYLRLSQASASVEQLVKHHLPTDAEPQGTRAAGGQEWVLYRAPNSEPVWLADLGDVRLSLTGSGTEDDFAALAEAVLAAPPR